MKLTGALRGLFVPLVLLAAPLLAGEGMWLLNGPLQELEKKHGFKPDSAWLEHVQKGSIRFNNGGSGSFVSADGLIITNHHVAQDAIYKLGTAEKNYLRDGFHARTQAEELRCVDLELNVLMSIEDVTAEVNAGIKPGMSEGDMLAARRAAKADIEKRSTEATGLRSDVVTLYQGGQYHLYRYKKYTDVRLVFAPEEQAAFFGGDPDNFEFPRFNLDCTFLRAYENGVPAKVEHYFKWSRAGVEENELVFVSGHPGSTSRQLTVNELIYIRDVRVPFLSAWLKHLEVLKSNYAARSPESARIAQDELRRVANSRKVYDGRSVALLDPALWDAKRQAEGQLYQFVQGKPEFADVPPAFAAIAAAQAELTRLNDRHYLLESSNFDSTYFKIARDLYRHAHEKAKPNGERLREFRDSNLASIEFALLSAKPIYDDFERVKLQGALSFAAGRLGADDSVIRAALAGQSLSERAAQLIAGTQLKDIEYRKRLWAMDAAQMEAVNDPFIQLVKAVDTASREVRRAVDEKKEAVETHQSTIARARFALYGTGVYPDATFTLRLSYGTVSSYPEAGKVVPPFTQLSGKFTRSELMEGRPPFDLPASWVKARDRMRGDVPYNFVSTCDIIGGNSGSPTLNQKGEFVGIIFDGNIYSLVGDYAYSDAQARAISVDSRGILEALKSVYGADGLVSELLR